MAALPLAEEPIAARGAAISAHFRPAPSWSALARWGGRSAAFEAAAGVVVAFGFTVVSMAIRVNPMTRVGQVSGLAALQLRFIFAAIAIAVVWLGLGRWVSRPVALRVAASSMAGLASGLYAGGVAVALRGTSWPFNAAHGDSGQLQEWVGTIQHGHSIPDVYPPLFPYLLTYWTDLFNPGQPGAALKILTLVLTALTGPAVYLAWRLLLPPLWALGIGVVSIFPIFTAAKPYVDILLLILVPVFAHFIRSLARSAQSSARKALLVGAAYGLVFAVFFLWYSGWFVWSAPGALACVVLTLVKTSRGGRDALRQAAVLLVASGGVFVLVAGEYLVKLLVASGTPDNYMYFDTETDPAYFVTWLGDLPGGYTHANWPLPGELGGVGVFMLLLVAGVGVALWLGAELPVVQVAGFFMLGSFMLRYWFASHMERDQLVQLYPRTSSELLYCCLVLFGMAAYLVSQKLTGQRAGDGRPTVPTVRTAGAVLCALAIFFATAGSATVNRLMPSDQDNLGRLAWISHSMQLPNGKCPQFAPGGKCEPWSKSR